jgi:hypothetical protein
MKYYNGGFIIISYEKELIYQNCIIEGLSSIIVTISNGIRPTFPDYWFFPWSNTNENESITKLINSRLRISKEEHEQAQCFLDTLIEEKRFSWPNVFRNLEDARFFKQNYLKGIEDLEIVSLNLSEEYRADFLLNEREENDFDCSIYHFMEDALPFCINNDEMLGFDICGYSNNNFYSFIHNNLQTDFRKYGKDLNELSLIANYEDAQYVIHLIDNQKIEAEEILWYPWLILRCS